MGFMDNIDNYTIDICLTSIKPTMYLCEAKLCSYMEYDCSPSPAVPRLV